MSIGIAELPAKKPKSTAPKKQKMPTPIINNLREYLLSCPNHVDVTFFNTQDEAYLIGNKLKELARKEEGAKDIWSLQEFSVEIGWLSVRMRFKQDDKPAKAEYKDPEQHQCPKGR